MSKKKKKFIKALKEWDVSEPIYLSDILKGHKESMIHVGIVPGEKTDYWICNKCNAKHEIK